MAVLFSSLDSLFYITKFINLEYTLYGIFSGRISVWNLITKATFMIWKRELKRKPLWLLRHWGRCGLGIES